LGKKGDGTSAKGTSIEAPKLTRGVTCGEAAVLPFLKNFSFLKLKIASFAAFWVLLL